jgi:Xaa-Pro aminopeptidase
MDYRARIRRIRANLEQERLDALAITHLPNIHYLCGFTGSSGVLVITERDAVLFTDGRYTQQAHEEVRSARIKIGRKAALVTAAEWIARRSALLRVGVEAAYFTVASQESLRKVLPRSTRLVDATALLVQLRMIKDTEEIARLRSACHLGVKLFDTILETLRPGATEAEVAGALEFEARKAGAEQMSFPTIVAAGARSALPHGRASREAIPARGFVVCDFGVILAGYCSDMTRTVHVGRAKTEAWRVYEAVHGAQQAALDAVKPGVVVGEVDSAARKLLKKKGLAKFFTHSTGHGVGLEIHEAPRIAANQKEMLQLGMVVTIEPGVYIPGKFGVRIEDTVVVTETGHEVLTPCSKQLMTL